MRRFPTSLFPLVALFSLAARRAEAASTFTKDIAPIMFDNCVKCHRPGASAPFSLIEYDDVRKRGDQIAEVTGTGYMPPWPPAKGHGEFVGERRLTPDQIKLLAEWVDEGMPEGDPNDLPQPPVWNDEWELGEPDLIVEMVEPFVVPADGPDIYRNFVVPDVVPEDRYVRAVEFRPGSRAVHHAFFKLDRSEVSRQTDGRDGQTGFPGIELTNAQMPEGQFLTWQPGAAPPVSGPGMQWTLAADADLIFQMHLQPLGKPEPVRAKLGLYFTNAPPSIVPYKIRLTSLTIDIPPGEKDHVVRDTFRLPIDVDVLAVLPHGHFLGKRFEGYAMIPGGGRRDLILIEDWDFNWQGDYRYRQPVHLPAGSMIQMRFLYDNSSDNPVNPHHPPQRVRYGPQTTDEMAELWLLVLTRSDSERAILAREFDEHLFAELVAHAEIGVVESPEDPEAHVQLGRARMRQRRHNEAAGLFAKAVSLDERTAEAHYFLGVLDRISNRLPQAEARFKRTVDLEPTHARACGNLGIVLMQLGKTDEARTYLKKALELDPSDVIAQRALDQIGP